MKRFLLTTSALTIFAAGIGSAFALISSAPAFNSELRRDNVFGQPILARNQDMYDRSLYLMQQAVSFVRADLVQYDGDSDARVAPIDVAINRGETAVALMQESLAINPGNAQGWIVMAWAQLYSGNLAEAENALVTSWTLAPYNRSLAAERLDMSVALFDPFNGLEIEATDVTLSEDVRAAILRDLELVRLHIPSAFAEIVEQLELIGVSADELPAQT